MNVQTLEAKRDTAKSEALESPLQKQIVALRDKIIEAKRKGDTAAVEALQADKKALTRTRDAVVNELDAAIAEAKRAALKEKRDGERKACEALSDDDLAKAIEEATVGHMRSRSKLRALTAEQSRRADEKNIERLVARLTPEEKELLKSKI